MTLTVGNSNIEAVYKDGNIGEIYKGSQLLWSSGVQFTINTIPADAVCIITYEGKEYRTKSLKVKKGSIVEYRISLSRYKPITASQIVNDVTTLNITMEYVTYNLTIIPTPSNARVVMNDVVTKSIDVLPNTRVDWSVSADGYIPKSGNTLVTNTLQSEYVTLKALDFPSSYGRLLRVFCTSTVYDGWSINNNLYNAFSFVFENGTLGLWSTSNTTTFSLTNTVFTSSTRTPDGNYLNSVAYSRTAGWVNSRVYITSSGQQQLYWVNENNQSLRLVRLSECPTAYRQVENPYWTATVGNNECRIYYNGSLKAVLNVLTY